MKIVSAVLVAVLAAPSLHAQDGSSVEERLEVFDPNDAAAGDATRSSVSGLNWYFKQLDLKLQLDWMRSRVPGLPAQQKVIARLQTVF